MSQPYLPQHDGQPDYPQQPQNPQFPQQIPHYEPQAPLPQNVHKPRRWPWIIALVVVFFIGIGVGSGASSASHSNTTITTTTDTTQPTAAPAKPTAAPKWTTIQTFSGSGTKKMATFAVGNDWKIVYTCSGMNVDGLTSDANFIVSVYNSDGTLADPAAVNTICKAGKTTSDNTEEHQDGNIYLDVMGEGSWTIQVQELK
jgi:hypothetical protein